MLLHIAGDRLFMHRFSVNLLTYNFIRVSRIFCGWTAQIWISIIYHLVISTQCNFWSSEVLSVSEYIQGCHRTFSFLNYFLNNILYKAIFKLLSKLADILQILLIRNFDSFRESSP